MSVPILNDEGYLSTVRYDFGKGVISICYSPEAMQRSIERGTYEYTLKNLVNMERVDECIRKSINLSDL